jgi:hypothetical protein
MCYYAQIERDWNRYVRIVGPDAALNLQEFIKKYLWRQTSAHTRTICRTRLIHRDLWQLTPNERGLTIHV